MCNAADTSDNIEKKERNLSQSSSYAIELDKYDREIAEALKDDETHQHQSPAVTKPRKENEEKKEYSTMEFILLVIVLFVCFGLHNVLQEAITRSKYSVNTRVNNT